MGLACAGCATDESVPVEAAEWDAEASARRPRAVEKLADREFAALLEVDVEVRRVDQANAGQLLDGCSRQCDQTIAAYEAGVGPFALQRVRVFRGRPDRQGGARQIAACRHCGCDGAAVRF